MTWEPLENHIGYEISTEYPHRIRNTRNNKIVNETEHSRGYYQVYLNKKLCLKHRVIAEHFIYNDDKEHKTYVDHINHNHKDNHVDNLRWVTARENNRNRSKGRDFDYEFIDELPETAVPIKEYKDMRFENLYYDFAKDKIIFFNGIKYRYIRVLNNNMVFIEDTNNKRRHVSQECIKNYLKNEL